MREISIRKENFMEWVSIIIVNISINIMACFNVASRMAKEHYIKVFSKLLIMFKNR